MPCPSALHTPARAGRAIRSQEIAQRLTVALAAVLLALAAQVLVPTGAAQAAVPATMSYQGILRDAGGAIPPDGEYAFVFRLYNVVTGGSPLWQESQELLVTGGLFHATLGEVTPLALPFDVQYWLETAVDGSALAPRVQLASSPYAQRAAVAEALVGGGGSGDITAVYADDGLTGGATSGDAHLAVSTGPGLTIASDQVRMADAYVSGAAHDARFVNEGQAGSVTVDMVVPNVVASVDGVVNDGGTIDLVAGANVTITPDDATNTITIAAAGGGGGIGGSGTANYLSKFTGATSIGNALLYDTGSRVGIGTMSPTSRLTVAAPAYEGVEVVSDDHPAFLLSATNTGGTGWIDFRRGGVPKTWMSESSAGLALARNAESGGIVLSSTTADVATNSIVAAKYTGIALADHAAVYGQCTPADYYGIGGKFVGGYIGLEGRVWPTGNRMYYGMFGEASGGTGTNIGVLGSALYGHVNYGIYGQAWETNAYAGFFSGNVAVSGNLSVVGSKQFSIYDKLVPSNKYM